MFGIDPVVFGLALASGLLASGLALRQRHPRGRHPLA